MARGNAYFGLEISVRLLQRSVPVQPSCRAKPAAPYRSRARSLDLVGEGNANQEIGQRLCVSVKTVEAHKTHIIAKLGLKGAIDLMKYAVRRQMIDLDA